MSTSTAPYPILEGTRVTQLWRVEVVTEGELAWSFVHLTEHEHLAERTLEQSRLREVQERAKAQQEGRRRPRRRYRLVTWSETMVRSNLRVANEWKGL